MWTFGELFVGRTLCINKVKWVLLQRKNKTLINQNTTMKKIYYLNCVFTAAVLTSGHNICVKSFGNPSCTLRVGFVRQRTITMDEKSFAVELQYKYTSIFFLQQVQSCVSIIFFQKLLLVRKSLRRSVMSRLQTISRCAELFLQSLHRLLRIFNA